MLHSPQVQQLSVVLLQHCPTSFYCPPCLPHHQLQGAGVAVDVPVPEPGSKGFMGELSESVQAMGS